MDIASTYDAAAPTWTAKLQALGYVAAYRSFLQRQTIATGPVLDAGCGTGTFAESWLATGGSTDLTLFDASAAMLSRATARLATLGTTVSAVQTTLNHFVPAQSFQTILAAHVIEHCPDPGATFHHLAQWLKPGGSLILVISRPHWCNWLIWLRFRHRWFSAAEVLHMAQSAGLNHSLTHRFTSGPPSRTSLGYIFTKS